MTWWSCCRCRRRFQGCPRCGFAGSKQNLGHCRKRGNLFNCLRSLETRVARPSERPRFVATDGFGAIGPAECPSIHAQGLRGHSDVSPDYIDYVNGDYDYERVPQDNVFDGFGYEEGFLQFIPPAFAAVSNGRELQRALRDGASHIVVTQHLDLIDTRTVPDLPEEKLSLDHAVGRVKNTTLSIVVCSAVCVSVRVQELLYTPCPILQVASNCRCCLRSPDRKSDRL